MPARLITNTHGKHSVRVSKIRREADRHDFVEMSVDIELIGDFDASYTEADNRSVVATDTCRNTIYMLANRSPMADPESFALEIAEHFVRQYDHVHSAIAQVHETVWERLPGSDHAFAGNRSDRRTARAIATGHGPTALLAGVKDFVIAKTTQSGFANFHRDEYRTLADTDDRILATSMTALWSFNQTPAAPGSLRPTIMDALLTAFVDHYSHSVQETLMRMGTAVLDACQDLRDIELTMPNKHHIPFNFEPLGEANTNEVFVVTDEPFGYIQATVGR